MSVTRAGYMVEYEIKTSRADFLNDRNKAQVKVNSDWSERTRVTKYSRLEAGDTTGPSRFYYVMPDGLIGLDELPAWAGLFVVVHHANGRFHLSLEREAPRIHGTKCDADKLWLDVAQSTYHRYWSKLAGDAA